MATDDPSGRPSGSGATRRRAGGRRYDADHPGQHPGRHRSHVRRRGGTNPWYGTSIEFQHSLEAGLDDHAEHRGQVTCRLVDASVATLRARQRILVYEHFGLDVPARRNPVPVRIEFHENPNYDTYGLPASDYPRVLADPGAVSKHRLPGDALCLWFPRDPDHRRWHHGDGLVTLLNNVRNHLFFEDHWRATGGQGQPGGIWLGDEAPHGFPDQETAA